ncbi:hypothetical protein EV294_105257 [Paenibacillus sp. BK033]|uniref:hypothetical protein n=1 Tax=Paenibacillus sp. BK033 TaxID=2512133 RepID=UPI00104D6900|nr:hypothetical protein [Paenibacillus sp. BK033]TCM96390.1 hypothetical protein EV294_105257 [Paenibacillus sp. BK033]
MNVTYSVKNPTRLKNMIVFSVASLIWLFIIIHRWRDYSSRGETELLILDSNSFIFLVYIVLLILTVIRALRKPNGLSMHENAILVNGHTLSAQEIKVIMKMGYFNPVIGIKPKGKKIVPLRLCFSFAANEDQGIMDLKEWAAANNVKMVDKDFMSWL